MVYATIKQEDEEEKVEPNTLKVKEEEKLSNQLLKVLTFFHLQGKSNS